MVKYSIVTAYINQVDMTYDFLNNLKDKITEDTEIIVVNAGNEIKVALEDLNFKRIDLDKNISFSHSMNSGIKEAKGDYVVIMGNDGFPQEKDWLTKLSEVFDKFPRTMISTPNNSYPGKEYAGKLLGVYDDIFEEYDFFPAVCWMISREAIDKVGLFDENFIIGQYEDNDYALRVRKAGGRIILRDDMVINHLKSQEIKHPKFMETENFDMKSLNKINSEYLKQKHNLKENE